MADINVTKDSKFVKVLTAQAKNERVDSDLIKEANEIVAELVKDPSPQNRHQLAQTVGFAVNDLQQGELDFLNNVADIKNVSYGDRAAFNVKTGGIKAYIQAKGSTTARSYIADRQVTLVTDEISARPAINIMDLRTGRVNMADLIREANREMTNMKLAKIEGVLHDAIDDYQSPFYATGTGVVKATLDAQLAYFNRLGNVTLLGDSAAVGQLAGITGFVSYSGNNMIVSPSDNMIDELNNNGYLGRYMGCNVMKLQNAYRDGTTEPVLAVDWIYILPAGMSADARNLKVVNEGGVNAFESQNIDDLVYEIRLDQAFGAGFVTGKLPTIGAYKIG